MLSYCWRAAAGYRLRPWDSPYLKWRVETYWGLPSGSIEPRQMRRFLWERRADLWRFLRWSGRMRRRFGDS
jgi:hypothetical protein